MAEIDNKENDPRVSADSPRNPQRGPLEEALAELNALVGLDSVKKQVRQSLELAQLDRRRRNKGLPALDMTHHLVFTGNAGAGKRTAAQIVGRIYKAAGLLEQGHVIECNRRSLTGDYVGHSTPKTQKVIDEALDGVLYIGDAHTLTPVMPSGKRDPFADEAIATLLKAMDDHKDRLVVIAAGPKEEMAGFIESHPGLESRFRTIVDFQDYCAAELVEIFRYLCSRAGVRLSVAAQSAVANLIESLDRARKGVGNGRTVRNIFDECVVRQARMMVQSPGSFDVTIFEEAVIPKPGEIDFDQRR